jgi:threonine/homoserine/homoserine lactone efflux protein
VTVELPLAAFLAAALLLAITPGPGIAYVVARTVAGGRREGLASCLGTGLGGLVHVAASAWGLSVLLAQSASAFAVVKWLGVAYLLFLGLRLLWRARTAPAEGASSAAPAVAATGALRAGLEGVVVEVLNVKTALFFLAFLPQFLVPGEPAGPQLVLLGCICVALNTAVDVLAVFGAAGLLASAPGRAARARWLERASGATMVVLALWLAAAKRPA